MLHASVRTIRISGKCREENKTKIESHKYFMWENSHKSLGASKKNFAYTCLRGGDGVTATRRRVRQVSKRLKRVHTHRGIMCRCVINIHCRRSFIPSHARKKLATESQDRAISLPDRWSKERRLLLMNIEESWCLSSLVVYCVALRSKDGFGYPHTHTVSQCTQTTFDCKWRDLFLCLEF